MQCFLKNQTKHRNLKGQLNQQLQYINKTLIFVLAYADKFKVNNNLRNERLNLLIRKTTIKIF